MTIVFVALLARHVLAEAERQSGADQARRRPGGNRDATPAATWKARKSASASPTRRLWATATTAASNGSVNSMHDSFTPLGGLIPMWLIQLGEVIFGGVGSGLYGMIMFAVITVFIAGLMIGRTPEYLGKKIGRLRDQDGVDRDPAAAADRALRHGSRPCSSMPARPASPIRPSTASRKSSTRSRRPATTTAARSRAFPPTRRSTTPRSASACSSRATGWRFRCSRSRAHWPQPRRVPASSGTLPTHTPLFVVVLIGIGDHRRRADLRAGAGARPGRRASAALRRTVSAPNLERIDHVDCDCKASDACPGSSIRS